MADVLVVDDDRDVAESLLLLLELLGHSVRYARDGEEGLLAIRERFPQLILLDIDMPRLTGPEMAYRMIVEDCGRENIPILVISAVANLKEIVTGMGTPYFLAKPFRLDDVERLTELALREKRAPLPPFQQPESQVS